MFHYYFKLYLYIHIYIGFHRNLSLFHEVATILSFRILELPWIRGNIGSSLVNFTL